MRRILETDTSVLDLVCLAGRVSEELAVKNIGDKITQLIYASLRWSLVYFILAS